MNQRNALKLVFSACAIGPFARPREAIHISRLTYCVGLHFKRKREKTVFESQGLPDSGIGDTEGEIHYLAPGETYEVDASVWEWCKPLTIYRA